MGSPLLMILLGNGLPPTPRAHPCTIQVTPMQRHNSLSQHSWQGNNHIMMSLLFSLKEGVLAALHTHPSFFCCGRSPLKKSHKATNTTSVIRVEPEGHYIYATRDIVPGLVLPLHKGIPRAFGAQGNATQHHDVIRAHACAPTASPAGKKLQREHMLSSQLGDFTRLGGCKNACTFHPTESCESACAPVPS